MRGRKAKSTDMKLLEGTFREDRPARETLQPSPADLGSPPEWIKGKAKWAWKHFAVALAPKGRKTVDRRHRKKLELLCKTYEIWRNAQDDVDRNGLTIILHNADGDAVNACKNPAVGVALAAAKECRLLLSEFNASAAVTGAAIPDEGDDIDGLIKRGQTR